MTFTKLSYEVKDRIAFLTMNCAKTLNALDEDMADQLVEAITIAEEDPQVKVVVLKSGIKAFSAGGDISYMRQKLEELKQGGEISKDLLIKLAKIPLLIKKSKKPYIASVGGAAAGAGSSLALCCDFCIASEKAKFIQAFARIGVPPDTGGIFILSRVVGPTMAAQLSISTRPVDAKEALILGMATEVCASEELDQKTLELAKELAAGASASYAYIKSLNYEANYKKLEDFLVEEIEAQHICNMTEDFKEGVTAFLEKRTAHFQ